MTRQGSRLKAAISIGFSALVISLAGCTGDQAGPSAQQPNPLPTPVTTRTEYVTLSDTVASDARKWSADEIAAQITDMTYLRNRPGIGNEVFFFSPDHVVYTWSSGKKFVETATWSVVQRTPPTAPKASFFICMSFTDIDSSGRAIVGRVTTRCFDPAILYVVSVDRTRGDVFGLRGREAAPFELPIPRTTISTLKQ